jgi:hypothetical protein
MNLLSSIIAAGMLIAQPATPRPAPAPPRLDPFYAGLGSCLGPEGPVDLRRLMLLENRQLDIDSAHGPMRLTLRGEEIRIAMLSPSADVVLSAHDIAYRVRRGDDEPDIALKLAILDGRTVLYWRETFQNRQYRQGLFSIDGHDLSPLCEGRGGIEVSH